MGAAAWLGLILALLAVIGVAALCAINLRAVAF